MPPCALSAQLLCNLRPNYAFPRELSPSLYYFHIETKWIIIIFHNIKGYSKHTERALLQSYDYNNS